MSILNVQDKNPLRALAATVSDLTAAAEVAGAQAAAGNDSIVGLALRVYASAKHAKMAPGDVTTVYEAYCRGQNATEFGIKVDMSNKDSMKSGASKLRAFHKLASVQGGNHGMVVLRAVKAINAQLAAEGKAKGGSHYERVLRVVRAVTKRGDGPVLTDGQILEIVFPPKVERDAVERLEAMLKTATLHADAMSDAITRYPFETVAAAIQAQIDALKASVEVESDDADDNVEFDEAEAGTLDELLAA